MIVTVGPAGKPHSVTRNAASLDRRGVVWRPALFGLLGGSARVTVVTAPPGSGKTVLLRSWISQAGLADRAGWVAAGREERDPQQFWLAVLGALRATVPGSALVRELTAAPDLDGWAMTERLLKDLAPLEDRVLAGGRRCARAGPGCAAAAGAAGVPGPGRARDGVGAGRPAHAVRDSAKRRPAAAGPPAREPPGHGRRGASAAGHGRGPGCGAASPGRGPARAGADQPRLRPRLDGPARPSGVPGAGDRVGAPDRAALSRVQRPGLPGGDRAVPGRRRGRRSSAGRQSSWPSGTAGPTRPPLEPLYASPPAAVLAWQGRLEEAEAWLQRAELAIRPEAEAVAALAVQYVGGWLELARGRVADALAAFRAAERLAGLLAAPTPLTRPVRAWLFAHPGAPRRDEARRAGHHRARRARTRTRETRIAIALLALAQDDPSAAAAALAPVLDGSARVGWRTWLVEAFLLEAIARDTLGDEDAADWALERALDCAEPDGVLLWFVLNPAPCLLERHARHRTADAALIAEIQSLLAENRPAPPPAGPRLPIEPLSGSELRVRALPADEPDRAGNRRRAVRLVQHGQDPHAPSVRQARHPPPGRGRQACPRPGPARALRTPPLSEACRAVVRPRQDGVLSHDRRSGGLNRRATGSRRPRRSAGRTGA